MTQYLSLNMLDTLNAWRGRPLGKHSFCASGDIEPLASHPMVPPQLPLKPPPPPPPNGLPFLLRPLLRLLVPGGCMFVQQMPAQGK
jgi:hypothetical protein